MILDLLSPVFPKTVRVAVLGGSSVLRALCGVAAGSSKGVLSGHFASVDKGKGNLGEVNAVSFCFCLFSGISLLRGGEEVTLRDMFCGFSSVCMGQFPFDCR